MTNQSNFCYRNSTTERYNHKDIQSDMRESYFEVVLEGRGCLLPWPEISPHLQSSKENPFLKCGI